MHENLFFSSDKEHFPQPQFQCLMPEPSLSCGQGEGGRGQTAGMPAIDVFSKGTTSFLHHLKPQIELQRFSHCILSQRETKPGPSQEDPKCSPGTPVLLPTGDIPGLPAARFGPRDSRVGEVHTAASQGEVTDTGVPKVKTCLLTSS